MGFLWGVVDKPSDSSSEKRDLFFPAGSTSFQEAIGNRNLLGKGTCAGLACAVKASVSLYARRPW